MKKFFNQLLTFWPIVSLVLIGLFSSGYIYSQHVRICEQIDTKLSVEQYSRDLVSRDRQLDRFDEQLRTLDRQVTRLEVVAGVVEQNN